MTELLHKNVPPAENHGIVSWVVADSNALTSLTVTAADVNKVAKVGTGVLTAYYVLTSNSPVVWTLLNNAGGGSGTPSGDSDVQYVESMPHLDGFFHPPTLVKRKDKPFTLVSPSLVGVISLYPAIPSMPIYVAKVVVHYGLYLDDIQETIELLPNELGYESTYHTGEYVNIDPYGTLLKVEHHVGFATPKTTLLAYKLPTSMTQKSTRVAKVDVHFVNPTSSIVDLNAESNRFMEGYGLEIHYSEIYWDEEDYYLQLLSPNTVGELPPNSTTVYEFSNVDILDSQAEEF